MTPLEMARKINDALLREAEERAKRKEKSEKPKE